ncbi:MAG: hypothetical protein QG600_359 [Patescibacteria group bacterium]|nr:hypothetical protein [Patescibacteria group bacterium]
MKKKRQDKIVRDLVLVFFSILLAGILIKTGTIDSFLKLFESSYLLTAFVAGILFTSIFTTAVGSAAFIVMGVDGYNPLIVGLVGGVGALVGDIIIFKFVREDLQADISYLLRLHKRKSLHTLIKNPLVQLLLPVLGGIVIASPLPDELGVTLLAMSHIQTRYFSFFSFIFNAIGIGLMVRFGALLG